MPKESGGSNQHQGQGESAEPSQHWFAGKDVDALFYKVNRGPPVTGETLFRPPSNILDHLEEVLSVPARPVESGRRFKREWRLGNKVFNEQAGTMTGMIGWTRTSAALGSVWDEERQSWVDRLLPGD